MQTPSGTRIHGERQSGEQPVDLSWDEARTRIAARWTRLNEHDLQALQSEFDAFTAGNFQLLVGRLRERYGLSQADADEQVRAFIRAAHGGSGPVEHSSPKVGYGKSRSAKL